MNHEKERVIVEGQKIIARVEAIVPSNPKMWAYLAHQIDNVVSGFSRERSDHKTEKVIFISIQSADGTMISQFGAPSDWFVSTTRGEIRDGTVVVGRVVFT